LKLHVKLPTASLDGTPGPNLQVLVGGQWRLRRGIVTGEPCDDKSLTAQELMLVDDKGRSFELAQALVNSSEDGTALEYLVRFEPRPGLALPVRLTYTAQRKLPMSIPFALKDVPLP